MGQIEALNGDGEILSILNVVIEMQQYMRVVPSTWNPNVAQIEI